MRQFNVKAWLIALVVALTPFASNAVGLGRLAMLSALGERLDVEIELVSVTKEELATLSARLSGPEAYRQANLQYNQALVGARVSIERRPNGQPFVKITSSRVVNEPFIDLLVEVTSSSGRLVREYTVLVDPPAVGAPPPAVAAAPVVKPAPVVPPPAAAPTPPPPARRPVAAPAAAGAKEYGPIQQGENLSKIARSVLPEGITLEQMMVGLYRSNPDAFIRNNLNLVKAGRILRVPDREEVAQIAPAEAGKEFRAQVADWNAYRQGLAGAAGTARAEGRTTAAGRITARVEDKAGAEPRDVVKLSRGEPPADAKGKPGSAADRVRALEEEVLAREKALNEANERISQLEKTIKDMQRLAELKSPAMAAAQQKAEEATKAKAASEPAAAPKPEVKPEPKPEVAAEKAPGPAVDAAKAPAPESKPEVKAAEAPKPKPKIVPAPPPPPPSMMDQVIEAATDPLYLGAGGGVIALGGLAFWLARRRRSQAVAAEPQRAAPVAGGAGATGASLSPESTVTMPAMAGVVAAAAAAPAVAAVDDVDPLAEAEVYIAYGRDAQAEEILKEALAKNPEREDVRLKLLEIYSARKDKNAFNAVAAELHKRTGATGDKWLAAAAMGYALDPANALYEAGRDAAAPAPAIGTSTGGDLDFDLGGDTTSVATDITLDSGAVQAATSHDTTAILDAAELRSMAGEAQAGTEATAAPLMPDFTLDLPVAGGGEDVVTKTDISLDAVPTQDGHMIDFQIELPSVDAPAETTQVLAAAPSTDAGLDFKLEVPDLDLGEPKADAAPGEEKDQHWYDVQTKFDLAKAFQEMGDKSSAREILNEVIKEGDTEQRTQAKNLLDTLS